MSNELEKAEKTMVSVVDKKMIQDFLFTSDTKLSDKQQEMFLQIAIRNNLDPFKREIYAIAYGKEFNIVTGYEVYIQRAEKTGNLVGWHCENTEEGAKITIHRKDWDIPFEWEVSYGDFDKEQSSWKTMRQFMIKKVCIGQGFRLAFTEDLGGMPYLKEEMEGAKPFNERKPPVQKTQSKSQSKGEKATIRIKEVRSQSGEKKGKPWTKYSIFSMDDVIYTTFSSTIGGDAEILQGTDVEVIVSFKTDKFGNTINDDGFDIQAGEDSGAREPGEEG